MNPILNRIKGWWLAATPTQRLTTLGGGALTLVLVAAVVSYAGRPKYTMLYGGLSAADQGNVVTEVQAYGIPVQYNSAGTVEVPEERAAEARMKLAVNGKAPKSAHPGIGDLGAMNLYTTPAVERERLKSILEGELSRSIETIPGVQSSRVHVTLGDPSPFGDQQRAPTASISVVQGNATLSSEQSQGIALLVSNAVEGLELKNVVVLNERMEPIFKGSDTVGDEHLADKKLNLEREVGQTEERKLQDALDRMFGAGSTLVTVRAEVDLDREDSTVNSRSVKEGPAVESAVEKAPVSASGTPVQPSGAAANGLAAGAPTSPPPASSGGGTYTNKVLRMEPGYVDTVTKKTKATGGLKKMLINVTANTGKYKDETESAAFVQSVKDFVTGEFKNQSDTTSFQAIVTPVKFDTSAQEMATKAQDEASGAAKRQQLISLLPVAALMIVGFLVVRSLGKFGKASFGPGLTPALVGGHSGGGALAFAGSPGGQSALGGGGGSPLEAALSGHFGEGSPLGLPEGARRNEEGGIEFESDDERIRITKIKERTSIPLEQIRQMSMERPDAVAMLVKTWLMDEKR